MHNREKPIDKAIKNNYSSNSHNNYTIITVCENLQTHSRGRGGQRGCGGCESNSSHNGY